MIVTKNKEYLCNFVLEKSTTESVLILQSTNFKELALDKMQLNKWYLVFKQDETSVEDQSWFDWPIIVGMMKTLKIFTTQSIKIIVDHWADFWND